MIDFKMPSLGADMADGVLVEWKKQVGDSLRRGDAIADVETQKGVIEIEVFDEGTLAEMLVHEGDRLPVGTVMARIRPADAAELASPTGQPDRPGNPGSAGSVKEPVQRAAPAAPEGARVRVTPLARRRAAELGVDPARVRGTGEGGAVTRQDVEAARGGASSESIRQAVAAAMSRSNRDIPHYYLSSTIDLSVALELLGRRNEQRPVERRLLPVVLFVRAVARALRLVPELNASWDGALRPSRDIHVGLAISLRGGGVIVPALKYADEKSLDELQEALNDLIPRARALRLKSSELTSSTITMTSLGDRGVDEVFGVIYPPQVALVGVGGIVERPLAIAGRVEVRPSVRVTLAGDHRATDGLTGNRFLVALGDELGRGEES